MNCIEKLWRWVGDTTINKLPPLDRGLFLPTRPAPPMPECKPPKLDISEPVITLLEELRKDVWEVSRTTMSGAKTVTHVYREDVVLYVMCYGDTYVLGGQDWMTTDERVLVQKAVEDVVRGQVALMAKLRKIDSRDKFSKALGVLNEVS